jgi:hypothetical protein
VDEHTYITRTHAMESYVNRLSFLCDDECRKRFGHQLWTHHAWVTMQYLAEILAADFYGDPRPGDPDTGVPHLDADIARARDYLERTWRLDASTTSETLRD